jgi:hypothetical protein
MDGKLAAREHDAIAVLEESHGGAHGPNHGRSRSGRDRTWRRFVRPVTHNTIGIGSRTSGQYLLLSLTILFPFITLPLIINQDPALRK